MAVSKVIVNGVVRVDMTGDTATAGTIVDPYTAHIADGTQATGSITAVAQATPSISVDTSTGLITATATQTAGIVTAGTTTDTEQLPVKTSSDMTVSGGTVTAPAGYYTAAQSKSVANGSATTPATTVTANPSISVNSSTGLITATASATKSVTPTVSAGYVSSGTAGTITVSGSNTSQLSTQAGTTITPTESQQTAVAAGKYTLGAVNVGAISSTYIGSDIPVDPTTTVSGDTVTIPTGYYSTTTTKSVASGTAGTPSATKGTVSNHSVTVTPSVTNTTGYISGGTKTGTGVTVTASELVSGTLTITANASGIDVTNYAAVDVSVAGGGGNAITIIDTTDPAGGTVRTIIAVDISEDTVTAAHLETGYTAHDKDGNPVVGTLSPSAQPTLQTKTVNITPTESAQSQTVTADAGYDGLDEVDVNVSAISSTYVGTGITRRSSTDLTASGATVTVPAGYYQNQASKAVSSGTVTAPSSISGTSATVSTATNTLTLSKTVSVTPSVTTAGYVSSGTAGNSSVSLTANVTTQGAQTIYPSTTDQTISSGSYLTGTQTIKGVAVSNTLTAANIKKDVVVTIGDSSDADRIMSVTGTYEGGGGSSMNVQIAAGVDRVNTTSYTAVSGQSITVAATGTYDVYWSGYRSSTGGTNGSQLYIGNTAYGSVPETTFSNNGQYVHLTGVSLTKNQVVTVRARARGTSYYMYVANLTIVQTA